MDIGRNDREMMNILIIKNSYESMYIVEHKNIVRKTLNSCNTQTDRYWKK